MLEKRIKLKDGVYLQSRAATNFVIYANRFHSDIYVEKDQIIYNGKSIMSILLMNACPGQELIIRTDGPDEDKAMEKLIFYLDKEIRNFA